MELGWVFDDQGRYEDALSQFDRALQADPRHATALDWRVVALRCLRRFEEAEKAAREALDRRPDEPDLWVELGWVFEDQGRYAEALAQVERALEIDPRHLTALRVWCRELRLLRRFEEAEKAARGALDHRSDEPDLWLQLSWVFDDQGRYEEALAQVERALQIDPRHLAALRVRCRELRLLNRFDEAQEAASEALVRRPSEPALLTEFGRIYDDQNRHEEALIYFDRALKVSPRSYAALTARSAALRSLRRFNEAEQEMTRAVEQLPQGLPVLAELGWIHHDRRHLDIAMRTFDRLRQLSVASDEVGDAWNGLGWAAFAAGRVDDAEGHFRAGCRSDPHSVNNMLGLAWTLVRQGSAERLSEAEALCITALRQEPRNHLALTCLGLINYQWSDHAQAEHYLRAALKSDPFNGPM